MHITMFLSLLTSTIHSLQVIDLASQLDTVLYLEDIFAGRPWLGWESKPCPIRVFLITNPSCILCPYSMNDIVSQ